MESLGIAIASFAGALSAAVLGWMESAAPLNWRKLGASIIRGLVAAVLTGVSTQGLALEVGWYLYLTAFLLGAGVDVLGKRAQAAFLKP